MNGRGSRLISGFSLALLGSSFAISAFWFFKATSWINKYEPLVQTLGLIGAILGIFVERLTRRREARRQLLSSIAAELAINSKACRNRAFNAARSAPAERQVYPRMRVSAVDAAFASGAVFELAGTDLFRQLLNWRNAVADFNRRLDLTELRAFTVANMDELREIHRRLVSDDGFFSRLRDQLATLVEQVRTAGEGIDEVARELATVPSG